MYVCICQAVTEKEIHAAIDSGVCSLEELQERLKVSTCCGACAASVEDCLQQKVEPRAVFAA